MITPHFRPRRLPVRSFLLAAALILPAASGGPALADESAELVRAQQAEFAASFAALPAPVRKFDTPAGAVDITAMPAPAEPAPTLRTLGSGVASYYGKKFAGRRTASGEAFNPQHLTAAHKTLPFGTKVLVTNPRTGQSVTVRINDRGPYSHGRSIDLSRAAAEQIGIVARGHGTVEMAVIEG
ncbi:septal ring lytic transglycosylase RlpA family protein [Allopontixanthobacter sp.]|uniref:septal ring lytic transglycosylase RlpA family protein n=1 Tax=Allopontixanthobacter sp. TaxID=2906452 RepID=UPI002AB8B58A|nr:septal ring lytic transglycosylase RlpA family protein [Allopontixanthobacter sp.]MDZ4306278.1 septal ring lytic transglycosylase RlpA family protein [Allopontixanthobacter sp.]